MLKRALVRELQIIQGLVDRRGDLDARRRVHSCVLIHSQILGYERPVEQDPAPL